MEGITVCQPPLPAALVDELLVFWQDIFQTDYRLFRSILNGDECEHNRDVFYLVRDGDRTVGSCHLTFPVADPALGGLGEVATAPAARGRGIASELCAMARDDFRRAGGSALFLGTANPAAARIYHRLGWRKLAGAHAMAHIADGRSPEAFFIDHFATGGSATGTAAARIPMIPLILCPHDDRLLDANAGWVSTRYADQSSCMGLYPRYAALDAWFCARAGDGRAVGLASARTHGAAGCQIDAARSLLGVCAVRRRGKNRPRRKARLSPCRRGKKCRRPHNRRRTTAKIALSCRSPLHIPPPQALCQHHPRADPPAPPAASAPADRT